MIVATDVGGTFTDYIIQDAGKLKAFKALTTPDPSQGIIEHLGDGTLDEFSHGTTAAVNAVLERDGGRVVFFTTKGFRDLVQIGRQARSNVYSFICTKPQVPVEQVVELDERTGSDGKITKEISVAELKSAAEKYSKQFKVAVVGFINSYTNPTNEIIAEQVLNKYFNIVVSSHRIRREIREYERFCTAVIEGFCFPVVNDYMKNLKPLTPEFYIMQSNGGRARVEHMRAVNMIMSGPAGGVAATQALCKILDIPDAIAYDMGGTSADLSAIVNGKPLYTDTINITGLPIKTLAIDIESIGAGGGSIAWVDDGGALKVGPESAGAHPGPACYNQGGENFTVSDANLLTGILGKNISEIELQIDRSLAAAKPLSGTLVMDNSELSSGVLQIVNNNMVSAMKKISIGKGYDPRQFTLVAFGGAGPMHACAIAEAIGIKRIIVPAMAGVFSALGILTALIRFDYIRTILLPLENAMDNISSAVKEFNSDLTEKVGKRKNDTITHTSLDLRYSGQGHEIDIPVCDDITGAFHTRHEALFGFAMQDNPIEVVNVKMVAEIAGHEPPKNKFSKKLAKAKGKRIVFPNKKVNVYHRDFYGSRVEGPCIIEEETTTVYVASNWNAKLDLTDVLILERD